MSISNDIVFSIKTDRLCALVIATNTPTGVDIAIYYQGSYARSFVPVFSAYGKKIPFTLNSIKAYTKNIFKVRSDKLAKAYNDHVREMERLKSVGYIFDEVNLKIDTQVTANDWGRIGTDMSMFIKFNEDFYKKIMASGYRNIHLTGGFGAYGLSLSGTINAPRYE